MPLKDHSFLISWLRFFCLDRTVGGRIKNKVTLCSFLFFHKKSVGGQKKLGYCAIFFNNDSRPIKSPHS